MRRKKTAHRPSQSHMEFVKNSHGETVRNTAYNGKKNNLHSSTDNSVINDVSGDYYQSDDILYDLDDGHIDVRDAVTIIEKISFKENRVVDTYIRLDKNIDPDGKYKDMIHVRDMALNSLYEDIVDNCTEDENADYKTRVKNMERLLLDMSDNSNEDYALSMQKVIPPSEEELIFQNIRADIAQCDSVEKKKKVRVTKKITKAAEEYYNAYENNDSTDMGEDSKYLLSKQLMNNKDKNIASEIRDLGGGMYLNYKPLSTLNGKSTEWQTCFYYAPDGLDNFDTIVASSIEQKSFILDNTVPKESPFEKISDADKKKLIKHPDITKQLYDIVNNALFAVDSPEKYKAQTQERSLDYDYNTSVIGTSGEYDTHRTLGIQDSRRLAEWVAFSNKESMAFRDKNSRVYDIDHSVYKHEREEFDAFNSGIIATNKKHTVKPQQEKYDTWNDTEEIQKARLKEVKNDAVRDLDTIKNTAANNIGISSQEAIQLIHDYSHSTYHSQREESITPGSTNKSFVMRKPWDAQKAQQFDNLVKQADKSTNNNKRTLYRYAEIPDNMYNTKQYADSLQPGQEMTLTRVSSTTRVGKNAVKNLMGTQDRKVVFRYNTTHGVSIAHPDLAERPDEGEVLLSTGTSFAVVSTEQDNSGNYIVNLTDI